MRVDGLNYTVEALISFPIVLLICRHLLETIRQVLIKYETVWKFYISVKQGVILYYLDYCSNTISHKYVRRRQNVSGSD